MKETTLMQEFIYQSSRFVKDGIGETSRDIAYEYLQISFPEFLRRYDAVRTAIIKKREKNGKIYSIDANEGILPLLLIVPELELERLIMNKKAGILKHKKQRSFDKIKSTYVVFSIQKLPKNKFLAFLFTIFSDRRKLKDIEILFLNYYYGTQFKRGELSCSKF